MGDSSRRRPLLAHEKEKDTSLASGDKNECWKSSVVERSAVDTRQSPVYEKRYSFDDKKNMYDDKQTSFNAKRTSYGDKPYSSRSLYDYNDQRATHDEKKPSYNKDSDDDERTFYVKKSFDDKRSSYDKKSLYEIHSSYQKKSFDEKKSLYDEPKSSYVDKKRSEERPLYHENSSSDKRPSYNEKKSLYEDKRSLYNKPSSVDDQNSPVNDWKPHVKDRKFAVEKSTHDRKSSTSDRKSSDEDWELSDDMKRRARIRSPVRERKPTVDIWRPKCDRSVDDKKSDWDPSAYRRSNNWNSSNDQMKPVVDRKLSSEDWDSSRQRTSNNWKSSSDQRKEADDRKLSDKEWDPLYPRSNNDRKSFTDQRKPAGDKLPNENWDSRQRLTDRKSFNDHRKPVEDRLSDEDWDSQAHQRSGNNRSNDKRKPGPVARRSSFDRKSFEDEQPSSFQQRFSVSDKRASSGHKKSDEDWDYADDDKTSLDDSKSPVKDRKSQGEYWKQYNKKSFVDDKKASDEDWESPAHRRSTGDKVYHDRKPERTSEENQNVSLPQRLSGSDRKTSNDKKPYLPDISHILDLIDKVKLRNEEVMTEMLCDVEQEIKLCLSHPEYTRVLIMKMYDRCKEDQEFAVRAGALCGMIHTLKFGDLSVKAVLLRCVQHDLEEKQHERGEEFQVLNSIFFLSELYHHMRINNLPVSILGDALLNHLQPLLLGEEAEFELLATCIIANGSILLQDQSTNFLKLMVKIRSSLIKEALSTKCRGWLLLIIELVSRQFAPLLPETCKWYRSLLGSTTFEKFERLKPTERRSGQ